MPLRRATEANRALWDMWTPLHVGSPFYDLEHVRRGGSTLMPLERGEVGDVAGKDLLHLQCHFGLDTLSWARLGARATGLDFSQIAVDQARSLSRELNIPAEFICADIESWGGHPAQRFDIVFTSYGVLSWLSDLKPWGRCIAASLKPGGFFYIVEFHPVLGLLDSTGTRLEYSYFHDAEPVVTEETATYAGAEHDATPCYQWSHSLADVINALVEAGLQIEFLRELPYCLHACYPFLVESAPGRYVVRDYPGTLPLLFSIRARLPAR